MKKKLNYSDRHISHEKVERHHYSEFVISLCVDLYVRSNCGFGKISVIMGCLNDALGWGLEKIPCPNSIENWVKKSGYHVYENGSKGKLLEAEEEVKEYALITDESMLLGSEKMFLMLRINALKQNRAALKRTDIKIVDISVASGWNSQGIKRIFSVLENSQGRAPCYVISDNDSKLKKSIREKGYIHIRDSGHTIALLIESVYGEDEEFIKLTKTISQLKVRESMKSTAYLLPPRQRTIARFMNLSATANWAVKLLKSFPFLSGEEKEVFGFLNDYTGLIAELKTVFECTDNILKILKNRGLSRQTVNECLEKTEKLGVKSPRIYRLQSLIVEFLKEECAKLSGEDACWHASSDIIESMFGSYKFRKSKNSLNGVTAFVLLLPLLTKIPVKPDEPKTINFKDALEAVYMKDLKSWTENHLTENLAIKRYEKLAG